MFSIQIIEVADRRSPHQLNRVDHSKKDKLKSNTRHKITAPADWVLLRVNDKTVLFRAIQFNISTQFKCQNGSISV